MDATNDHEGLQQSITLPPAPPPPPKTSCSPSKLQDYQTQLLLLERENKERLEIAYRDQANANLRRADGYQTQPKQSYTKSQVPSTGSVPSTPPDTIDPTKLGNLDNRPNGKPSRTLSSGATTTSEQDQNNSRLRDSSHVLPGKAVPISRMDSSQGIFVQEPISSQVCVQTPLERHQSEPSSVAIEDHASQKSSIRAPSPLRPQPGISQSVQPKPSAGALSNGLAEASSRAALQNPAPPPHQAGTSLPDSSDTMTRSRSSLRPEPQTVGRVASPDVGSHVAGQGPAQLQNVEERRLKPVDKRASKMTMQSTHSDRSSNSEPNVQNNNLAAHNMQPHFGEHLLRPDSVYSSTSDLAHSRNRSPQRSLNGNAQASSSHSASPSPDQRPLSYVNLLNVPYPQAPPVSTNHLDNAQLRTAVGSNASLLSIRRTLEMYRANVEKTNDPAIQYEFAVFMISAAHDVPLDAENKSSSQSSPHNTHGDLLKEARQILQKLSDRSYPFAQYYLADGYSSGLFNKGKGDYEKAFALFVSASKHGHAEAGYRAALCYEFGWGCRVDGAKATQFFRQAASKNHPGAMLRFARACLFGEMGLAKRYREGVKWLKRAAESADYQYNSAPYELGLLHESGYGDDIFRDESYAAQLFTKSADLGHAEANYRLGMAYEHGTLDCPQDSALSVHFYTGAAQQSYPSAMMALCAWYMVGADPVLEKDENEAYEWALRAAETGLARAEYTVGFFTEVGIGCRRDALEANVWYVRAADQGDEKAIHRIAAIRAAATGADPVTAALPKAEGKDSQQGKSSRSAERDNRKPRSKRFGIF